MSQRHGDPVLDAAQASVLAVGVRRTTMTDVAKRAGVSRMTLYRRFPDVTSILQELMTREFGGVVAAAQAASGPTARERIVGGTVEGADRLSAHPLFQRLLDVDPELLLPYFTMRVGAFQTMARAALADRIREGQADGSVRDGDADLMAGTLELAVRGYVFSARADDAGRSGSELARMIDGWLAP